MTEKKSMKRRDFIKSATGTMVPLQLDDLSQTNPISS